MLLEKDTRFSLPSSNNDGFGLRVDFDWMGDRFRHSIVRIDQDLCQVAWESLIEQSPVFQHLHQQTDDGGRPVLFLIGAADHIHWSMSVHAAEARTLCFDVAGRVSGGISGESLQDKCVSVYARPVGVADARSAKDGIDFTTCSDGLLHASASTTKISAQIPPGIEFPCTVRWSYIVRC